MRKIFTLATAFMAAIAVNAQVLLDETFDYGTTTLATVAGDPTASATANALHTWYKSGKPGDSNSGSIAISNTPLSYSGYTSSGKGKAAEITNAGAGTNTRIDVVRFVNHDDKIKTGVIYYAFMLNASNMNSVSGDGVEGTDWRDIFVIAEGGSDVLGNSLRGRLFLKQDPDDASKIYYSVSKNTAFSSSVIPDAQGEIAANQTYLFVLRQTFENNKLEVIVNPALETEPSAGWIDGRTSDSNTFGGTYGLGIRRRNLANSANVLIGGIRVAQTWKDVIGSVGTGISDNQATKNNILVSGSTIITKAGSVKVINLAGAEVINQATTGNLATGLSNGLYIAQFTDADGNVTTQKILIK